LVWGRRRVHTDGPIPLSCVRWTLIAFIIATWRMIDCDEDHMLNIA